MEISSYPYRFVKRFDEPSDGSSSGFMRYRLLYSFRSPKSHQWYWVWVEAYEHDMYAIKFHLKAHRDSPNKYTIMTGLCEPRPVINTCVNIMLQIASMNPNASFGFVGAASPGEPKGPTKRFRFYSNTMAYYFSNKEFLHFSDKEKSTYIMLRRRCVEENPNILSVLEKGFKAMYSYFD